MTKITHATINGIEFDNCEFIDLSKQTDCPLENTKLADQCCNEYQDLTLRSDQACPHKQACLAALKNSRDLEQ